MESSRTITLFALPPPSRTGPSPFMVSVLLHGVVLSLMFLAISHSPRIDNRSLAQRYTVRILKLHETEPQLHWSSESGIAHPAPQAVAHAAPSGGQPAAASVPRQLARINPARLTLVQPDAPNVLVPLNTPIPLVVMWTPENIPTNKIVPPPPQKATAANVRPSLTPPNHEAHVADIELSSSASTTETLAALPSTTSPLAVRGPGVAMHVPQTSSKPMGQPTPATVMSVSDVLLTQGAIALPLANETARGLSSESLMPGRPESTAEAGSGTTASKRNGSGPGQNAGDRGDQEAAANGAAGQSGATTGSNYGSDAGSTSGNEFAVDRIVRPKDGRFGVVVVGSSLADEYPETLGMWADRLAYTVYLHVGQAKSWILQYSLPRTVEAAGRTTRPDAPWPYLIVRPHLASGDSDADAVIVHGFINTGGRFEQLAIVFPPRFPQTKFVLGSLKQWQFRPATQNGQLTAVEVLLIIPEEVE